MPRYRLTTVTGQRFIVESRDDHESVVRELLAKGFLFGAREDSTGDMEAVLGGNVVSVAAIAGTELFTLPEFNFTPPARKSAPSTPKKAAATPQKAVKKKPKR
jgi:hypothetical protein